MIHFHPMCGKNFLYEKWREILGTFSPSVWKNFHHENWREILGTFLPNVWKNFHHEKQREILGTFLPSVRMVEIHHFFYQVLAITNFPPRKVEEKFLSKLTTNVFCHSLLLIFRQIITKRLGRSYTLSPNHHDKMRL